MEPCSTANSLTLFDDDYVMNNIDTVYPILLEYFAEPTEDSTLIHALRIAFGPCLDLFSLAELDEKLLKHACPVAKKIFIQTLREFENVGEDSRCEISENFRNCEQITSMLAKAIESIAVKVSTIGLMKIGSLLLCSTELLYEFYSHCSKSKQFFGSYMDFMSRNLTSFFRKAQDLQQNIFQLFSKIEIASVEFEIDILNEILTFIYKSGMVLLNLDVKTMADLWKGYISTLEKYSDYLKNDHEISIPVECLSENLTNKMEKLISKDASDSQNIDKTVKILCFILKVIIKITEKFRGCLKNCQSSLLNLLINLNKFGHPHLKIRNVLCNNLEHLRQLVTGVDPLLTCLISDKDFAQEFSIIPENMEMNASKRYPVLLLSCLIVKKLTFASQETRNLWFSSGFNILRCIFQLLNKCNFELCLDLKFPCIQVPGEGKQITDFYGYLLICVSAFLLLSTSREFSLAEEVLMKYILRVNPWCCLLAGDVWCILARFADSELCYDQLNILVRMFHDLGKWSELPQKFQLESLIKRLFPLLSRKNKELFVANHPRERNGYLWSILESPNSSENLNNLTVHCVNKLLSNRNFIEKDFMDMESAFLGLRFSCLNSDAQLESKLPKLWKLDSRELISNPLSNRYFNSLTSATRSVTPLMTPNGIYQVLHVMKRSLPSFSPVIKLHCLEIVYNSSKVERFLKTEYISNLIASFFYEFLTNQNVFIRVKSMELFSNFAYSTSQTQVITQSINNDGALQNRLKNYFQRKPNQDFNIENYLDAFENSRYEHFCKEFYKLEVNRNECHEPPHKKIILETTLENSELDNMIFTLKEEAVKIQKQAEDLSVTQRKEISLIADLLRDILK